ncbi:MAG TPA: hypothetical protein V6D30_19520 [Leptolyngbyaceae cyanobacterium]
MGRIKGKEPKKGKRIAPPPLVPALPNYDLELYQSDRFMTYAQKYLGLDVQENSIKQVRDSNTLIMETQVWMPLPYIPIDPSNYPPALVQLGVIYNRPPEIGQDVRLTSTVTPFAGTYFHIKITGLRDNFALALSPESSVGRQAEEYFFSKYPQNAYRRLTTEEYYRLYPEERDVIPGRVINPDEF